MSHVWTYWEGDRPRYIDVCLQSIERASKHCEFNLVTPSNVWNFVPRDAIDISLVYDKLKTPAHRADCIRAALLAVHGGLYVDADTVCIRSLETVANMLGTVYMVWPTPPRRIPNGYIVANGPSGFAGKWLDEVNRRLHSFTEWTWSEFGEQIITPLIDCYYPESSREMHISTFMPIDVDSNVGAYFKEGHPADFISSNTVAFGLNNSYMMHHHHNEMTMSISRMSRSNLLIHKLLVYAYGQLKS